ncbi:MAG TPA: transposase [Ktedonobacterales bacterium]|nr:transposase [Ktedonobacterales bacterium]
MSGAAVPIKALPLCDEETGIDRGLASFAPLADGSPIANPRILRVAERNLKRAQRRVSRRQHGSRGRRKAVRLLARAHQRVRRARADFHHKMALALVRQYDTLSHEALQPANRVQHHSLAKSSSAAGWSGFLSLLSCKAGEAGKTVIAVPAAFTSQACSGCGVIVQQARSVRWHLCPVCGMSLHRDHTAAITILRLGTGHSGLGRSPQASTWPVGASVA